MAKLSPESPDENSTLTPVESATMNVASNAALVAASVKKSPSVSPHESVTTDAPLVTADWTAFSSEVSVQSWAPKYPINAPGAIACTAWTSSDCSARQPLALHRSKLAVAAGSKLTN